MFRIYELYSLRRTPGTFRNNKQLELLLLSHNKVKKLHPDTFINNDRLEQINLNHNQIDWLPSDIFRNQKKLDSLLLRGNQLGSIPREWPMWLKNLNLLDLSGNRLISVHYNNAIDEILYTAIGSFESLMRADLRDLDPNTNEPAINDPESAKNKKMMMIREKIRSINENFDPDNEYFPKYQDFNRVGAA